MPALLLHLTAVERLTAGGTLSAPLMHALKEDVEYLRLGAALPDLPYFDGVRGGLGWLRSADTIPFYVRLFHGRAPVAMGLKMAELVAMGALVGSDAGLAFVCGYFTHLCLDRALHPMIERLVALHRRPKESVYAAHRRIEWLQARFYTRSVHGGADLIGDRALRAQFQVTKHGLPARGIGRGFYEVVRLASQETFNEAPPKAQVDGWVRGLFMAGVVLSSPLGRAWRLPASSNLTYREMFRGDQFDLAAEVDRALAMSRDVLERVLRFIARGSFTPRSRQRFMEEFPEGSVEACAPLPRHQTSQAGAG